MHLMAQGQDSCGPARAIQKAMVRLSKLCRLMRKTRRGVNDGDMVAGGIVGLWGLWRLSCHRVALQTRTSLTRSPLQRSRKRCVGGLPGSPLATLHPFHIQKAQIRKPDHKMAIPHLPRAEVVDQPRLLSSTGQGKASLSEMLPVLALRLLVS